MNIFLKIKNWLDIKHPFVVYRKPNTNILNGWFQQDDFLYTSDKYTEKGFIFAPFDAENTAVLIPENNADFLQENTPSFNFSDKISEKNFISQKKATETAEKKHLNLVEKGIQAIVENQFKKVVLSRKEAISLTDFNAITAFQKLLTNYKNAFTYIWFHPKVGLWLGATPETLVKINAQNFETMALAGTQIFKGTTDVFWQSKEIEEQQFVTDYITSKLETICTKVQKNDVETIKAGNLLHLKTLISGEITATITSENTSESTTENSTLLKKLHPTPAVCGLPLEASKAFILKNENYNRSYYAGFLGELNLTKTGKNTSELFVNLRCMEIKNNTAFIYVGGGITKDSNPKSEWLETVAKTATMKKVL
ncbi:isochorismate synthase [Tenacibaculum piscium]|uniref:isochorismate synthase n=1 Tax=Tenacibaculum piscium TaxID=1458515 RepID=UPI001F025FD6|nr:isochorismate synthase [Tenacibaculum piscium]